MVVVKVMNAVGVVRGIDEDHDVVVQYPSRQRYTLLLLRVSAAKLKPFYSVRWTLNPAILKKVPSPSGDVERNGNGTTAGHPPPLTLPPAVPTPDPFEDPFQVRCSIYRKSRKLKRVDSLFM